MEAVPPSKSLDHCMCSVHHVDTTTNKIIDMTCLSNEEKNPSNIENNGENREVDQHSTSFQAINYLRGDVKCNKVARKDDSFKDKMLKFTHDCELVTVDASSAPESVVVLNSMLFKKVIDKIDDLDKKLKSL